MRRDNRLGVESSYLFLCVCVVYAAPTQRGLCAPSAFLSLPPHDDSMGEECGGRNRCMCN